MIGNVGLEYGRGDGESDAERRVVGCSVNDETESGKEVIGCGYLVGNKSNDEDNNEDNIFFWGMDDKRDIGDWSEVDDGIIKDDVEDCSGCSPTHQH